MKIDENINKNRKICYTNVRLAWTHSTPLNLFLKGVEWGGTKGTMGTKEAKDRGKEMSLSRHFGAY